MDNKFPFITVLTTVYNGEKYLKEAIDSIINQTYANFEYIIINNGSKDNSPEIIRSYKDPRIVFVDLDLNIGLSNVRNLGYEKAKGKYVALLDADDIALPERLEKQVQILENNPEIGLCSTNLVTINEKGEITGEKWFRPSKLPLEWQMLWSDVVANSSSMVRKEILEKYEIKNNPDLFPVEDYDLWCNVILNCRMYRLDEVLIYYRVHGENTFFSMMEKADFLAINIIEKIAGDITKISAPEFHKYFSIYSKRLKIQINHYDIIKIISWFNVLLINSSHKWNWVRNERNQIKKDIYKKIIDYIKLFEYSSVIKDSSILIADGKLWCFYLIILTIINFCWEKIKKPLRLIKKFIFNRS